MSTSESLAYHRLEIAGDQRALPNREAAGADRLAQALHQGATFRSDPRRPVDLRFERLDIMF